MIKVITLCKNIYTEREKERPCDIFLIANLSYYWGEIPPGTVFFALWEVPDKQKRVWICVAICISLIFNSLDFICLLIHSNTAGKTWNVILHSPFVPSRTYIYVTQFLGVKLTSKTWYPGILINIIWESVCPTDSWILIFQDVADKFFLFLSPPAKNWRQIFGHMAFL